MDITIIISLYNAGKETSVVTVTLFTNFHLALFSTCLFMELSSEFKLSFVDFKLWFSSIQVYLISFLFPLFANFKLNRE